jgi:hypothetical protein
MNEAKTTPPATSAMMRRMPDHNRLTRATLVGGSMPPLLRTVYSAVSLLVLCAAGGCACSTSQCFQGSVAEGAGKPAQTGARGTWETSDVRPGTGLKSIELEGVGTLAFLYDRPDDPPGGDPILQAYLVPGRFPAAKTRELLNVEPGARSTVEGAYAFRGTVAIEWWKTEHDFRIRIDAQADDPKATRVVGTLRTCTDCEWDIRGLVGPM